MNWFGLSVVIPAFDAAETIALPLDSLLAQTDGRWEAVVVDDGSRDQTADLVDRYARLDSRIRLFRQENAGPSSARNRGIDEARYDWLLFLDADDWVSPVHLETVAEALTADPDLDAVHYGCAWVWPEGQPVTVHRGPPGRDLFPRLAGSCVFTIHACVVKREFVLRAGRFAPDLDCAEDWLLWQRVARIGARFGRIDASLAHYRCTSGSLSGDLDTMFRACLRVIDIGHGVDPGIAVPRSSPHYAGAPPQSRRDAILNITSWHAGGLAAAGRDPVEVIPLIPPDARSGGADSLAACIHGRLPSLVGPSADWACFWARIEPSVRRYLEALEVRIDEPDLGALTLQRLERLVAGNAARQSPGLGAVIGRTAGRAIELTQPIGDLDLPGVDRLVASLRIEGEPIAEIELPVIDDKVTGWVLVDALGDHLSWQLLGRFFERTVYRDIELRPVGRRWSAWVEGRQVADGLPADPTTRSLELHDQYGWQVFESQVWAPTAGDPVDMPAGAILTIEIADPLPTIRSDGGHVLVEARLGGSPIAVVSVPLAGGVATGPAVRQTIEAALGYEVCRVAVRDALLGRPFAAGESLRGRLQRTAAAAPTSGPVFESWSSAPAPGANRAIGPALHGRDGCLIGRRDRRTAGRPVDRRAMLPIAAAERIVSIERRAGTPIVHQGISPPRAVAYAPEFLTVPSPDRSGNGSEPIARGEVGGDGPPRHSDGVPILMYHRVAATGFAGRDRYRIAPEEFEAQLRLLHDAGYSTLGLEHCNDPEARRGDTIVLTFDDGFADFETSAWPLLRRHGFTATVFLVTGSVGRWNRWDPGGEDEPLMDWKTIRRLHREGVRFGAHSVTHPFMSLLPPEAAAAELIESRAAIEERLDAPVTTFAYPYGDFDRALVHLVGAAGYSHAVTCEAGFVQSHTPVLELPRFEVPGGDRGRAALLEFLRIEVAAGR